MAKSMKSALLKSTTAERESLDDRFSKADKILGTSKKTTTKKATTKTTAKKAPPKPKVKIIRDAFTMPEPDYALIKTIQDKALKSGLVVNKSEIIRAGLLALNSMGNSSLKQAVNKVEKVKTGRPKE